MEQAKRLGNASPRWRSSLRTAALTFLWSLLLLAIIDYGAVAVESRIVLALSVHGLLIASLVLFGIPSHARLVAAVAAGLFLTVGGLVFLQSSVPASTRDPVIALLQSFTGRDAPITLSMTPSDDWLGLLSVSLPFGFFLNGLLLIDTDERALKALRGLAIGGGLIALVSLIQFIVLPGTLGFAEKRYYLDSLTGFFVNRNTAATFFGLILLLLVVNVWRGVVHLGLRRIKASLAGRAVLAREQRAAMRMLLLETVLLIICFTALMMTLSRGGILATFAALAFLAVRLFRSEPHQPEKTMVVTDAVRRVRLRTLVIGSVVLAVPILALSGRLLSRFAIGGVNDSRFCLLPGILKTVEDGLPLGSGLSSFALAYAPNGDPACGTERVLLMAHNVYLEGLTAFGLAFVPLLFVFFAALIIIFRKGVRTRLRYRFAGQLGLAALLLVTLHSLVDFSVQIPGFAISFAIVLAPLATLCLRPSAGR